LVPILLAMLGIVLLAGLVVVYVAYPYRGEDVPNAAWVGVAMRKGADRLPTLDDRDPLDDQDTRSGRDRAHLHH